MSNVAIVAIPSEDDYVWRISSEKVPHLTILNLGENPQNISRIVECLEHVTKIALCKFGLSVDYRGVLGEDEADVLFFDKEWAYKVGQFRSYLLMDDEIRRAYDSTEQYPEWVPHLTLGYPDTPAKEDKREYPGITWINFDRVAIWTDDYAGPTFRLDDNNSWEFGHTAFSGAQAMGTVLEHFGVKGMRWGVKKSESHSSGGGSEDHNNATAAAGKAKKGGVKSLSNKELQDMITRMNLEQQYVRLAPPSKGAIVLKKGGQFVGEILVGVGKSQASRVLNDQATKLVAKALAK